MTPHSHPALRLNADFRPLSVAPLSLLGWEDAMRLTVSGRADAIEFYDHTVRSARRSFRLPKVVVQRVYQRLDRPAAFTRLGVYLREGGACAYCRNRITRSELTFDHVVPQSTGGATGWLNCVACCADCNLRKGCKSLSQSGMRLHRPPYVPNRAQLNEIALRQFPPAAEMLQPGWHGYLGLPEPDDATLARVTAGSSSEAVFPADMTAEAYWNAELES